MREELDEQLVSKYPKLFVNRHKSIMETCMCWGFEHGDGWFNIIDKLCADIQSYIDRKSQISEGMVSQVVVDQVKEKFGTLRFYYSGGDDYISGLVHMAESISSCTCEICGDVGRLRTNGWHRTLCDKHA